MRKSIYVSGKVMKNGSATSISRNYKISLVHEQDNALMTENEDLYQAIKDETIGKGISAAMST